ncbi:tRNA (adenine(22)-N(1))-methyltransferase [Lederbergia lenta]|uniref:tRNA (adenine(22)-N(1))-methyltransferase n=1 Tax=Lederbergia lenta TaxID=1467 RepID=UPI0020424210|nr:tRNA (adenine(22)-N(1))-methyltransferase TrmK [Lederbergia lenta]MCM3111397.1 tRNA (adenine(22)-N(1))-methyltransferase TrmK [Lederbergia lenta]
MNVNKLSKRLDRVVSYVIPGSKIADIGSDHAYLPCYAIKHGVASRAVAGEVVEGPYQAAIQQVNSSGLKDLIDVRKGNGLAVIEAGEVDCIVIAGMGGALITEILETGKEKLEGVKRLILQPNLAANNIRRWMLENEWQLIHENILCEDNKSYEVLVAEKGNPYLPYTDEKKEILLGPYLLQEKNEIFQHKWLQEIQQWEKILQHLKSSEENEANRRKQNELLEKINMVKEALS